MTESEPKLSRSALLGMLAMGVAVLVIANDFTALSVALPAMEKSFGIDLTTAQWVINGYAMVFGICIVTGGRLADMYGRRRIFFIGSAIFAFFSVIGGFAPQIWLLLVCRGLMGIGGALMWPAILGMTYALLPRSKAGLAGGLIIGAAGIGNAFGPLLGGALTDSIGWRWVFFINLPVAVIAVLVTWAVVAPDDSDLKPEPIDYRGMTTLSLGLFALLLALDEGTSRGWTNEFILACFAVAAISLVSFAMIERREGPKALVPDDVLANRTFLMAVLNVLMMSAIFFASMLYLPQFMSKQLGFSAVGSGAGLLPMMGTFGLTSFVAGFLYARLGAKLTVSSGAALLASGMFLLSRVDSGTTYADLVPGMVTLGLGVGLFYSSITTAAITALDTSRASLAGAIVYMLQIAGGSLGLGLNTAIVVTASSLDVGIGRAFLFDGCLAVIGLALSLVFVPGMKPLSEGVASPHRHRAHH
jgi:EmrB/QacA subfamily drug resistance transporter